MFVITLDYFNAKQNILLIEQKRLNHFYYLNYLFRTAIRDVRLFNIASSYFS